MSSHGDQNACRDESDQDPGLKTSWFDPEKLLRRIAIKRTNVKSRQPAVGTGLVDPASPPVALRSARGAGRGLRRPIVNEIQPAIVQTLGFRTCEGDWHKTVRGASPIAPTRPPRHGFGRTGLKSIHLQRIAQWPIASRRRNVLLSVIAETELRKRMRLQMHLLAHASGTSCALPYKLSN